MSGIFGLVNLDGKPVAAGELRDMGSLLTRRGPDRTGIWHEGSIGLGHTLLATTPEMLIEDLPLEHQDSGCVITGDIRLDNRDELLAKLDLGNRAAVTGDAGIAIAAYLEWGEACVERFLGDFAFAIWDPRRQGLFCARDHMGMRQLVYHHSPGRFFAFAAEPRAILVLPQSPYRINDARIADFLVGDLEGIDKTSTFFEEVYRLPPAHTVTVSPARLQQRRYWKLEPGAELGMPSDRAYAQAFLEVFTEAVRCRLRTVGPIGAMLSGGIDSGSVVAIARQLLAEDGRGPLRTFSAVAPEGDADTETRTIRAALTMDGLDPTLVSFGELEALLPDLAELTWDVDEPFDGHMTLIRTVYLAGHRQGVTTILDGAAGDVVLSEGRALSRLLRAGRWRAARREAVAQAHFWGGGYSPMREIARSSRSAFIPDSILRTLRRLRPRHVVGRKTRQALIDREFARRVDLLGRLELMEGHRSVRPLARGGVERAIELDQPYVVAGRERYDRVAAALAVEPRDPFFDRRVVEFCVRLPDAQASSRGWPKAVLRRAMAGRLPDAVRWLPGKEHLGWEFTRALMRKLNVSLQLDLPADLEALDGYVDSEFARSLREGRFDCLDEDVAEQTYNLLYLAKWLQRHHKRYDVGGGTDEGA